MRDWTVRLRARLVAAGLEPDVIEEIVEHAREVYRVARAEGHAEEAAFAKVDAELVDLPALVRGAKARASHRPPPAPGPPTHRPRVLSAFVQDLAYAVRVLAARPSFTAVAIVTLALGIGANTALFSVLNAVILAPLPFPEPDRLVMLWEQDADDPSRLLIVSAPNFQDWTAQSTSCASTAIWEEERFNIAGTPEPEQVHGLRISSSAFEMLGVRPQLGRAFTRDEDEPGHDVAIISDALWKRRYAADPSIVGRTIRMNGRPFEIVGVMPAAFRFTQQRHAVWVPIQFTEQDRYRASHSFYAAARLKPGVRFDTARAEMEAIGRRLAQEYEDNHGESASITPMNELGVAFLKPTLLMLQAAVVLVLLIACVNVANLLLAEGASRRREFSIRAALGAGRGRLVSQLFAEGLVLAVAGATAGVALAWAAVAGLAASFPASIRLAPFRDTTSVPLDLRVLAYTGLVAVATGLVFSIAPMLAAVGASAGAVLRDGSGRTATGRTGSFRAVLMAVEVALAVVVLAGAGLMLKSMSRLLSVDPGFDATPVVTFEVPLPQDDTYGPPVRTTFCADVHREVGAIPGVVAAGAISHLPLGGSSAGRSFVVEGRPVAAPDEGTGAAYRLTCPGYFAALGIPIRHGRDFTDRDVRDATPVALINETTARRYWPGEDPVGKRIKLGTINSQNPWITIVGVVGDVRHFGLDDTAPPEMYRPYSQAVWPVMTVAVRTAGDPMMSGQTVRAALRRVDPDVAVSAPRSMGQIVGASTGYRSFPTRLLTIFAGVALVLAAIGVYGVVGYLVTQRTREIGIRIALGARRAQVMQLVVGRSLLPIVVGLITGGAAAVGAARLLTSLLFRVQPWDPAVLLGIVLVLGTAGVLASWVPARRAASVDPLVVLRND